MNETVAMYVLPRGTDQLCGEGCGRRARIEFVAHGGTYCADCLFHLVSLGRLFAETVDAARDHLGG